MTLPIRTRFFLTLIPTLGLVLHAPAGEGDQRRFEVSADGHVKIVLEADLPQGGVAGAHPDVPFSAEPDWANDIRRQIGGLQAADMNNNGLIDAAIGCYNSQSFPPYNDWRNMVYFNVGGELEAQPSWISTDQVSTGDLKVADITGNGYLDVFAANGGFAMASSVIYFNGPEGLSTSPGWSSAEPGLAWNNNALPVDLDHSGFVDVVSANQGNSPENPYRPMYAFLNTAGTLSNVPGWQSQEWSIQNRLAAADFDGNGFYDIAVSKWVNFENGIYRNSGDTLENTPMWTTGLAGSDRGAAAADVAGNGWPDVAFGTSPTSLYANDEGNFTLAWEAEGTFFGHNELLFADVNGNGLPDLAEIHFSSRRVNIYLNLGDELSTEASWTWVGPSVGTNLAFGDITGNGQVDLLVANAGEPSLFVFYAAETDGAECPGDLNDDGVVDVFDLLQLLAAWGACKGCPEDLNEDDVVDVFDLLILLGAWGPCPR